jgi:hypothetical protein
MAQSGGRQIEGGSLFSKTLFENYYILMKIFQKFEANLTKMIEFHQKSLKNH